MKIELKIVNFLAVEGKDFTISEIARKLDEYYSFVHRIIGRLVKEGVVKKRKAGRAYLCSFNFSEKALIMLKLAELEKKDELYTKNKQLKLILEDFLKPLESKLITAVLFGSYSKCVETKESDIDILLITRNRAGIDKAVKEITLNMARKYQQLS